MSAMVTADVRVTTTRRPGSGAGAGSGKVPFARLFQVELRKQLDTRAGRALLIIIAVITAGVMVPMALSGDAASKSFMFFASGAVMPQMLLLPVIGIMAATSEWSQRTGLVTFALEPRRGRIVAAKTFSALLLGLASIGVSLGFAAVANVAVTVFRDAPGTWTLDWSVLGGAGLVQLLMITQGVAFGLLLLNTAAALVTYYILPTALTILVNLVSALREPAQWFDLSVASAPLLEGGMTGEGWARMAVAACVWIVLPFVLGTLRVLRREVK